ncbi:hypothetical protein Dsin_018622 [Dipteronia sinensis]|uniref:Uncharacterized protein n=1 Tax=Dipteronia sinensis TaxID=43782 RepID=A0AAE0A5T9_9ROSI|nr:hypothetical protein Dsin_018622 [Dipteronia sinensis]
MLVVWCSDIFLFLIKRFLQNSDKRIAKLPQSLADSDVGQLALEFEEELDRKLVQESFLTENVDVLSLLLASSMPKDSLVWHFDKSKVYSVRIGYKLLDDFQEANVRVGLTITKSLAEEVRWHGPDVGFYKINMDAAVFGRLWSIGLGAIWNKEGLNMASSVQRIEAGFFPQVAEAFVIL